MLGIPVTGRAIWYADCIQVSDCPFEDLSAGFGIAGLLIYKDRALCR